MLKIGDTAPNFTSTTQVGDDIELQALVNEGPVIVYFYPADFSPVCTAEACSFRDNYDDLRAIGAQVIGVSPQSGGSHKRFADAFSLPFPLLSDSNKTIIKAYGVNGPLGIGVRRVTFLIGADMLIRNRVVSDLFVGSHTELLKKTLREHGNH